MDTNKLIRTLDAISYETKLGKNLKNTLRKVEKSCLMNELNDYNIDLTDKNIRHVDMSNGKKNDDGYRGYHIYYKKSSFHYPIEVQFFMERDYIFNMWLHKYVYKYKDNMIGVKLKELYDKGIIKNEDDFKEELKGCIIY
ncbi:MAG: hypothetical protein ACRC30_15345 [Clostridium sp.]